MEPSRAPKGRNREQEGLRDGDLGIEADLELGRRATPGGLGQILLVTVFMLATRVYARYPWYTALFGSVILSLNLLRFYLGRYQARYFPDRRATWNLLFKGAMLGPAAAWGALFFLILRNYGVVSFPSIMVVLVGSGIAAAMTTFISQRRSLGRTIMTLVIGGPLLALISMMSGESIAMAVIFVVYYGFLWRELDIQHADFWHSIRYRKKLTEERNRLQDVLNAIPGLVSWTGPNLVLHGVNNTYAANYGATEGEYVGKCLEYKNSDLEFLDAVRAFRSSPATEAAVEVPISRRGTQRWHLLVMRKTESSAVDRSAMELYLILLDIHELKRTKSELEQQRIKSEQTSKLALLGEFTASLAHEIKTPLTAIRAAMEAVSRNVRTSRLDAETLRGLSDQAIVNCGRIDKIVNGLTRFSRKTEEEPYSTASVSHIVKDAIELTRPHFRTNHVSLEVDPMTDELTIWCRPVEIAQVLVNLLGNAVDAAKSQEHRWVKLSVASQGDRVTFVITDSGPGISLDITTDKLFEPFFTTKPAGVGTGLGLSISKRIIERHGGSLVVDRSAPHTTFKIVLPLAEAGKKAAVG